MCGYSRENEIERQNKVRNLDGRKFILELLFWATGEVYEEKQMMCFKMIVLDSALWVEFGFVAIKID